MRPWPLMRACDAHAYSFCEDMHLELLMCARTVHLCRVNRGANGVAVFSNGVCSKGRAVDGRGSGWTRAGEAEEAQVGRFALCEMFCAVNVVTRPPQSTSP